MDLGLTTTKHWKAIKISKRYTYFHRVYELDENFRVLDLVHLFRNYLFVFGIAYNFFRECIFDTKDGAVVRYSKSKGFYSFLKPVQKGAMKSKKNVVLCLGGMIGRICLLSFKKTMDDIQMKVISFYELGEEEGVTIGLKEGKLNNYVCVQRVNKGPVSRRGYHFVSFFFEDKFLEIKSSRVITRDWRNELEYKGMYIFSEDNSTLVIFKDTSQNEKVLLYYLIVEGEKLVIKEIFDFQMIHLSKIHESAAGKNKNCLLVTREGKFREHPIEILELWKYDCENMSFHLFKCLKSTRYYSPVSTISTFQTIFSLDENDKKTVIEMFSISKGRSQRMLNIPRDPKNASRITSMQWMGNKEGIILVSPFKIHVVLIVDRKRLDKRSRRFLQEDERERIGFVINSAENEWVLTKKIRLKNISFPIELSLINM